MKCLFLTEGISSNLGKKLLPEIICLILIHLTCMLEDIKLNTHSLQGK